MRKILLSLGLVAASAFYVAFSAQSQSPLISPATLSATAENGASSVSSTPPEDASKQPVAAGSVPAPAPVPVSTSVTTAPPSQATATAPAPAPAPAPPPKPKSQYVDGTYTGIAADAFYGNVQVEAVIQGGRMSNVKVLQYPNTHGTSVYINSQALPYLTQEAIQIQSANVNIVSGATLTSDAFRQSLASALTKAKA